MKKSPRPVESNPRLIAARLVYGVIHKGESLSSLQSAVLSASDDARQRALAQELAFGTLRWSLRLDAMLAQLMRKPLKRKDADVRALLLVGLYQLFFLEMPAHAAVSETVEALGGFGKDWARGLVNGVLRTALRQQPALQTKADAELHSYWSHPLWWIQRLQQDWPDAWRTILEASNRRPPMALRVNRRQTDRKQYLARLAAKAIEAHAMAVTDTAVVLEKPLAVDFLPGFRTGAVSVQDAAAQLSAPLLMLEKGQRVLDACAAPGGKTCHILEQEAGLEQLVAIDSNPLRLQKIGENLQRLALQADCVAADAADPGQWWDGRAFDRILLDAPCSASGVVRRHPDIKVLRQEDDLLTLSQQQHRLLDALWPLLASGGILLYATCSVFKSENSDTVQAFLQRHTDAHESEISARWGQRLPIGRQILPGEQGMDGFYFARLIKA